MSVFSRKPMMAIFACFVAAQCLAAPSVSADTNQTSEPSELTPLSGAAGRAAAGSDSKSVDLLLQMQQRSAGISFNARVRPEEARDARARQAGDSTAADSSIAQTSTQTAPTPPSGLFGTGATPAVTAPRNTMASNGPSSPPHFAYGANAKGSSGSSGPRDGLPRWLLLPHDVIDYVRENRATMIGGVAALAALTWIGSIVFSRRRS